VEKVDLMGLNKVSARRAADRKQYRAVAKVFLDDNPRCWLTGAPSTDLHHSRGRAGRLYSDDRFFVALCRKAHDWARDFPRVARELGLVAEFGGWNSEPRAPFDWPYGSRMLAQVVAPSPILALNQAEAALRSSVARTFVRDERGLVHALVGIQADAQALVGDWGWLTAHRGGPHGGHLRFRRDE
jgi:hypothetical protein